MRRKCLMIETKDHRKFFTHPKNFDQLMEFSKVFNAEISVVKTTDDVEVMDLVDLAGTICDTSQTIQQPTDLEILEVKVSKNKRTRKDLLNTSKKIEDHIFQEFRDGNPVALKDLYKKYKKYGLSLGCLCNHATKIRKKLQSEGYKITKLGPGTYEAKVS